MCTLWSCIGTTIIRRVMDDTLHNQIYYNVLSNMLGCPINYLVMWYRQSCGGQSSILSCKESRHFPWRDQLAHNWLAPTAKARLIIESRHFLWRDYLAHNWPRPDLVGATVWRDSPMSRAERLGMTLQWVAPFHPDLAQANLCQLVMPI